MFCLNDFYEGGLEDNMLSLLYSSGRNVNIAITTPNEMSKWKIIDKLVMQGIIFGYLIRSKTDDTVGKECLEIKNIYISTKN